MSLNHSNYEFKIEEMIDKYKWRFSYVPVKGFSTPPAGILFPYYPDNEMGEAYNNAVAEILGTSYGYRIVRDWMAENPGQPFICFGQLYDCLLGMSKRVERYESVFDPKSDQLDRLCEKFLELGKQCYETLQERDLGMSGEMYGFRAEREYDDNIMKRSLRTLRRDLISGKTDISQIPESTKRRILENDELNYEFTSKVGLSAAEYTKLKKIADEMRKQSRGEEPAQCSCESNHEWER